MLPAPPHTLIFSVVTHPSQRSDKDKKPRLRDELHLLTYA
jgi:hypothetical protein